MDIDVPKNTLVGMDLMIPVKLQRAHASSSSGSHNLKSVNRGLKLYLKCGFKIIYRGK